MDEIEKNRTFRFAEGPEADPELYQNQCREHRQAGQWGIVTSADGELFLEVSTDSPWFRGQAAEPEPEPSRGGLAFQQLGRHNYLRMNEPGFGVWDSFEALAFPDLKSCEMVPDGQEFDRYSTYWEATHSPLVERRSRFTPVVDPCGLLIGYYREGISPDDLWMSDRGEVFYAENGSLSLLNGGLGAKRIAGEPLWYTAQGEIVGWHDGAETLPPLDYQDLYSEQIPTGDVADVLLDIDGYVVAIHFRNLHEPFADVPMEKLILGFILPSMPPGTTGDPFWESEFWMVDWMFLIVDLASLGTTAVARRALMGALRVGSKAARFSRKLSAGLKGMQAAQRLRSLVLRGPQRLAIRRGTSWTRRARLGSYIRESGMPAAHFTAAQKAVDETGFWVLMRPTNGASMKWIEKGFPPKGLDLKVKTSKTTGLVTATADADWRAALDKGFLVVEKQGDKFVAVNKAGKRIELEHAEWPLEHGQVLHAAEKKPFVGDYDILDVIQPQAPGRNLAVAASNGAIRKDWRNPVVHDRFMKAFNAKLDRPRALHGGQSQFSGIIEKDGQMVQKLELAGLLDEGAVLLRPGKQAAWLPDRSTVVSFYEEVGRPTIVGRHQPGGKVKVDHR